MKKILTLLLVSFFATGAYAQWTYTATYSTDAGNPGGLVTETDAPGQGTWTTLMPGVQAVDVWSPATAIPFAFDFYGSPVSYFKASQSGLVTFDTSATALPIVNNNLPTVNLPDSTICGFWDEFTSAPSTGSGDDIRINTFGTAPNRQFWIKWYSFEMGNPFNSFNYFAIVLEEGTNNIYVVDQYSNAAGGLTATLGVQLDNATAVQFGDSTISNSGNGSGNTDNDFYTFTPLLLVADDAGVVNLDSPPLPLVTGMQSVDVTIENLGTNNLNSVDIFWEVNGAAQTMASYSTPLTPGATASVNLGMYNFLAGVNNMKFWTANPNGGADGNPSNDTLEINTCTALAGTYTIGGVGADFNTITEAVDQLQNCGISGAVTFNLAPGTYNEGVTIPPISGASATNTITFDGGSAASVTVSHTGTAPNAVFALLGVDYLTLTNMTIVNTGTIDAWGIRLANAADYNTISNNIIQMDQTATTDNVGIAATASATAEFTEGINANYTQVLNNTITGGDKSIHFEGFAAVYDIGNQFIGNDLSLADESGIYLDNQDLVVISDNNIHDLRNATTADGIYTFDLMNFTITGNTVSVVDYGIYIADGNFDFPPTQRGSIVNNMVRSTADYGMYFDDITDVDIFHNTSYGEPGIRINDFPGVDIRNNIFVSDGDFAFEADDEVDTVLVDYNIYQSGGTNLVDIGPNLFTDLVAWQTAQGGINGASLEGDPGFVSGTDLHVKNPIANDVGDNSVGVTVDIDGDVRPQAPSTIVDIGADEFTPLAEDVGVIALTNPVQPITVGVQAVDVTVENFGATDVNSLDVFWEVGGIAQPMVVYNSTITSGGTGLVSLGTYNFPSGTTDMKFWTANPNGIADGDPSK